jgi:hypothetical protein
MSPLLAQSGHARRVAQCPLSGVKRTSNAQIEFFRFSPKADIGLTEIPQCSKLPYCDVGEAQGPQPQARFRTVTTAAMWQIFLAKPV